MLIYGKTQAQVLAGDAKRAYDDFEHEHLVGRAVLRPETRKGAEGATPSSRTTVVTAGV